MAVNRESTKKYIQFRPVQDIQVRPKPIPGEPHSSNSTAKAWFKYSIRCILQTIKESKGDKNAFTISAFKMKMMKKQFQLMLAKIINGIDFTSEEQKRMNHLIRLLDIRQLKLWGAKVQEKIEKAASDIQTRVKLMKIEPKKKASTWVPFLFGGGSSEAEEKQKLYEEEIKKLYSILESNLMEKKGEEEKEMNNDGAESKKIKIEEYFWLVGEFQVSIKV